MNTAVINQVTIETQLGNLTFPQVVQALRSVGIESYFVDFATGRKTFYASTGATHSETMSLPLEPVAEEFSASALIEAIRGAQADTVRYPEFVRRSTAAGVIAYWAFLAGKKVTYFGRKGEMHIEEFPHPKD